METQEEEDIEETMDESQVGMEDSDVDQDQIATRKSNTQRKKQSLTDDDDDGDFSDDNIDDKSQQSNPQKSSLSPPIDSRGKDQNAEFSLEGRPKDILKKKSQVDNDATVHAKPTKQPEMTSKDEDASMTVTTNGDRNPGSFDRRKVPTISEADEDKEEEYVPPPPKTRVIPEEDDEDSPMQRYLDELFGGGSSAGVWNTVTVTVKPPLSLAMTFNVIIYYTA